MLNCYKHKTFSVGVVFEAPGFIHFVYTNMIMNSRQPYAIHKYPGHQPDISWGRAVARIPHVRSGGYTHKFGQVLCSVTCA